MRGFKIHQARIPKIITIRKKKIPKIIARTDPLHLMHCKIASGLNILAELIVIHLLCIWDIREM